MSLQLWGDMLLGNIPGMIVNDDNLDESGWLRSNGIFAGGGFLWDFVRNDNAAPHADPVVFTLSAGSHELQISRREDGVSLDAIALFAME